MIRTIIGFIRFWLYLVVLTPQLAKVKKLDKAGLIAERDEWVAQGVGDWARFVVSLTGAKIEVSGEENLPSGAVVFVCNHQSNFDIPILLGFINKPKAFISKIEILKIPILNDWMKLMQCSFLDRKDMRQSLRTMAEAVDTVKRGYSLVIFPEGTRSRSDTIGEFKAGSFKLAVKAGVPIIPLTMNGSWHLFEETGFMRPGTVRLTVHPPVDTANLGREDTEALSVKVKAIIESGMKS